jgi:enoyl-CoA hydratase
MSEIPVPDVPVLVEMGGGVAEITLNRPAKINALTPEMLVRLDQAWAQISKDPEIRVVILTGAGERAFCAGADLGRLTPLLTRARQAEDEWDEALLADPLLLNRALLRGTEMITPVIAALRGQVVGGGMELMLGCDLRVAAEECRFGLMEVRRGLVPAAGGIARLSRQVAQAQAAEILLVGDRISRGQGARHGAGQPGRPGRRGDGHRPGAGRPDGRERAAGPAQGQAGDAGVVRPFAGRRVRGGERGHQGGAPLS